MSAHPAQKKLLFSIANPLYRSYLQAQFRASDGMFVDEDQFAYRVAEDPQGVLILQSDEKEHELLEMCKKLKRLFPDTLKIVLLSADYQVQEYSRTLVDAFVPFPVTRDDLLAVVAGLSDKKHRILLIDDSKLVHKHLVPALTEAGYEVTSAMDGQEGVERAQALVPDLIITDIEMPRMNGFEACRAIRQTPALADVPLIMSSTLGSAADQRKGFAAGVDEYITKPVNIPDLLGRLEAIFHRQLAGRENVLVVEPEPTIARLASKILAKQGFSPRVAASVKDAARVLKRYHHEVVLSEAELPDGSGLDLLKVLKALPPGRTSSLLVLTDQGNQAEVKMMLQAGAEGALAKPFTQDNLVAGVERIVANQRAALEKAHIEKYVSKASRRMAVEKSILSGSEDSARAYRKTATIFFSDIKEFTARCERYSPKQIVEQINTLFSVMTRAIGRSGGDIDKFIGDACMAFWMEEEGRPSADQALGFLTAVRQDLAAMNAAHPLLKDDPIAIRMGLNTGEVILADIGAAEARIDLTMIGDAVNLASRLESAGKQYGVDNLVSEFTLGPVRERWVARSVDLIRVKGKTEPVEVFEVFGPVGKTAPDRDELAALFGAANADYRAGRFAEALAGFEKAGPLEERQGALNPSSLLAARCRTLLDHPPETWDGVWTLTAK